MQTVLTWPGLVSKGAEMRTKHARPASRSCGGWRAATRVGLTSRQGSTRHLGVLERNEVEEESEGDEQRRMLFSDPDSEGVWRDERWGVCACVCVKKQ